MRKKANLAQPPQIKRGIEQMYPNIADWVGGYGWIEIGHDDWSQSFIRVLDSGGLVWESKPEYKSLDHAMRALEKALGKRIEEIG